MRVLGIDPGSRITGFGIVQVSATGKIQYIASGCIRMATGELSDRLKAIYDGVQEIIGAYRPTVFAAEKVFMARNADAALKLGQARGAALCAAVNHGLAVNEYTALQIKRAVVGRGAADKQQVQHMVRALLALDRAPPADAADALACAICHAHRSTGLAALSRGWRRSPVPA